MLRISKMADYAIVVLADLADAPQDNVATSVAVAARTSIPEPTVAKVMKPMTKSGWLVAQRGARGGYKLAQPLAGIAVSDVITLFDGPLTLTNCGDDTDAHQCKVGMACRVRGRWAKVSQALHDTLRQISVADLIAEKRG
ncbi:MAG: SUF system Fe-S cluster assembly regulator [Pseudomonadota bacterium]